MFKQSMDKLKLKTKKKTLKYFVDDAGGWMMEMNIRIWQPENHKLLLNIPRIFWSIITMQSSQKSEKNMKVHIAMHTFTFFFFYFSSVRTVRGLVCLLNDFKNSLYTTAKKNGRENERKHMQTEMEFVSPFYKMMK